MSGHTKGPWTVQRLNHVDGDLWLQIGHFDGAREIGPVAELIGNEHQLPVARLKYLVTPESEQWANAHLIAASPSLLAAAKAVRATCPADPDINPRWNAAWDALIAAIAKAEGTTP